MTQLAIDLSAEPSYIADDFVVSDCNRVAYQLLMQWPHWPTPYLWIHGAPASGKTHLAHIFLQHAGAYIISPDQIKHDPASYFQSHNNLIVDGPWLGVDETALFHLMNYAKNNGKHILFIHTKAPSQIAVTLPDLRSRLNGTTAIAIEQPDDFLLQAVMMKLLTDRQMSIAPDIIAYVIKHIDRSCEKIHQLVELIDKKSLEKQRKITLPFIREVLENLQLMQYNEAQ